jgi:hypothetical protein
VGKLNFLPSRTRLDIAYATHQIARFVSKPKVEHTKAVKWLTRYLMGTRDRGYLIKPDPDKSVEIYVDADFAGNWDPELAGLDPDTAGQDMDLWCFWPVSLSCGRALCNRSTRYQVRSQS